jgi:LmbE family N-acetylglucosaminyl deacetylase
MAKELFLFISPHLDDAALSCGGLIKRLTKSGHPVLVATVFTSDLPQGLPMSWLARRNQMAWGAGMLPFASRRDEDVNAMKTLEADHIHLGLLDAMYRMDAGNNSYYVKNTVGVPVVPIDMENCRKLLTAKFQEIQSRYGDGVLRVFCPMGLGGHVDHMIVRNVVESFWKPDEIVYYEDYPYAGKARAIEKWNDSESTPRPWKSFVVKLTSDEISARIDSVAQYASQLRGLFPSDLERLLEIAQARLNFLAGIRFRRNYEASYRRAESVIGQYIQNVGGEKYWLTGERQKLPDVLIQS